MKFTILFILFLLPSAAICSDKPENLQIPLYDAAQKIGSELKVKIMPDDGILNSMNSKKFTLLVSGVTNEKEAWDALTVKDCVEALKRNGYAIIRKDDVAILTSSKNAAKILHIPDYHTYHEAYDSIVYTEIKLIHITSDLARPIFRYVSNIAVPIALPDRKTILITDWKSNIDKFIELLKKIDIPQSHRTKG